MKPFDLLVELFRGLEPKHKANLRWHLKMKTPILCGKWAYWFTRRGAG